MNIVLFIDSLRTGGAQRQFALLADGLAGRGHCVTFVTLFPGGQYWDWLTVRGHRGLRALYKRRSATMAQRAAQLADAPRRLRQVLELVRADTVYSALHTSNLLAWLAFRIDRRAALVWSVRSSRRDKLAWKQRPPYELCRLVARDVPLIIANSRTGLDDYLRLGFRGRASSVVPNGIDVTGFRPDPAAGRKVRLGWGVPDDAPLVGLVARLDPVKDHPSFLRAAALVAAEFPRARFACVGDGPTSYRADLERQAAVLGLADRLVWAGERRDMMEVYNAFDIVCLSSRSEGFPNVIAEAMASAVPCVATRVGDVAEILSDTGSAVAPGSPAALADGLKALVELPSIGRQQLGRRARNRIAERYSVAAMVTGTEEILMRMVEAHHHAVDCPAKSASEHGELLR